MNPRVLIVDDEQSMCEMLEVDLGLRQFDVSWHTSAQEAFRSLESDSCDVVLTDLKMPGIDGIEFCRRIVANRPDIPVIVMTAFGSMEAAVDAIRAGAYDFVTKPVEMDLLALILKRAVEH
ncbi:MAG: response regulator, partial [Planctomycetes bacterium]|nr:response regulator [Planctomycetota bacterium]